jgi:hypothetical protein
MNPTYAITATVLTGLVLFTGCSKEGNPASLNSGAENYPLVASLEDKSGQDIAAEVAGMSEGFNFNTKGAGLAKQEATADGSITWQSWTYSDGWWHRSGAIKLASLDGSIEIEGADSVRLLDPAGAPVQNPLGSDVRSGAVRHHAMTHIAGSDNGYIDAARDWQLSATLQKAADTTLTLSGTLNQSFKAENGDKTSWCNIEGLATVTDVVYRKGIAGWSKPIAGSVNVASPYKNIAVVFNNGKAHITVTAKDGAVVKDITITL